MGVTFIGHASFFVQMGGENVLVDPNFARWLFVLKRLRQPGLQFAICRRSIWCWSRMRTSITCIGRRCVRLCSIRSALRIGADDCGSQPCVRSGFRSGISRRGRTGLVEQLPASRLTITHVPSRHWGARMLKDAHRGYGGYVLRGGKHSVYHAGDTAYFSGFREIGRGFAATGAAADWGLQSAVVSQRPCQSGGRHPRFPRSEFALDGSHALRNVFAFRMSPWTNRCNCWNRKP